MAGHTNNSSKNNKIILGIDEVGRGPWAGPLVVGAVILNTREQNPTQLLQNTASPARRVTAKQQIQPTTTPKTANPASKHSTHLNAGEKSLAWQDELTDSKKLTPTQRKTFATTIFARAAATGLGWVSSEELDHYGLSTSLKLATRRAVKQILATKTYFDEIIIDGTVNFLKNTPLEDRVTTIPKADFLIREVSAASIIAKHSRDEYMKQLQTQYPFYSFETNSGYGTAKHQKAIDRFGLTPEHRHSFKPIQEYLKRHSSTPDLSSEERKKYHGTTMPGRIAEIAVAEYLQASLNQQIIAQNWYTKFCEIDIVSQDDENIYFTEVKYSSNLDTEGTPLARIDHNKRTRMKRAAELFIQANPNYANFAPHLAVASVVDNEFRVQEWFTLTE